MDPSQLDTLIHQRSRLAILAYLYRNRQAGFTTLRDELDLTGGTVSKHADKLHDAGYLRKQRTLTSSGFETRYKITSKGEGALEGYAEALQALLGDAVDLTGDDRTSTDG